MLRCKGFTEGTGHEQKKEKDCLFGINLIKWQLQLAFYMNIPSVPFKQCFVFGSWCGLAETNKKREATAIFIPLWWS